MAGTTSYYNSRCSLPSGWEQRVSGMRNQQAMQFLKVDGTRVRYIGPGIDDSQSATIRANYPVPADCPLYYFEMKVLDGGQKGFIGIGFCTEEVFLGRLPGWDAHSYGYHGDDGHAFGSSGRGRTYGPKYGSGDIIGALYDKSERTITFFKNGESLGVAFPDVQEAQPLFPCIGMQTRGEDVVANFGISPAREPFRTDFAAIRANLQRRVIHSVRQVQLPLLSSRGTALLPQLMYDYLMHQRYWRTAAILKRDMMQSGDGKLDESELAVITVRQQSYDLVAEGRIDEALALVQAKYPPELLTDRPSLDFRLRLQKFVEMITIANAAKAVQQPAAPTTKEPVPPPTAPVSATSEAPVPSSTAAVAGQTEPPAEEEGQMHADASEAQTCCTTSAVSPAKGDEPVPGPVSMEVASEDTTYGSPKRECTENASTAARHKPGGGREAEVAWEGDVGTAAVSPAPPTGALTTSDVLAYGSTELMPRCRTSADRELLTDALSLLAFEDPASSPADYLLHPTHRTTLAESLNGALLACRGLPAISPLERLYQQAAAALGELKRGDHTQALALPDARQMVMEPSPPAIDPCSSDGGGAAAAITTTATTTATATAGAGVDAVETDLVMVDE